ncbi:MAG: bifunctional [glutamate--ammonia ligase]-adenylyl-L-tyrosine phosphorylase/[glutamate--ammonia-ligase] adenylyltransferase [Planctomycetes bacterium]|nr:bifunctional [glutamate--ammonia ligase]-adenylyl-L-tyrosine phosphorylase/[glutamate--ammonia-ligase] adenylyltransferase [Planctomycetota bacterium]
MDSNTLRAYLDSHEQAGAWLQSLGLRQPQPGHANLVGMARAGITLDLLAVIATQLERLLPSSADPDRALNNLERYVGNCRSPLSFAALLERDPTALVVLLQLFSTSQHFSDLVIADPEYFEELRLTAGRPIHPDKMRSALQAEVEALQDPLAVALALRRFRQLQMLRIGYGDIVRGQSLEVVTGQLSHLADCVVEVALGAARRHLERRHGTPRTAGGERAGFVVIAMGKLGGEELNYSSDIDLVFLFSEDGETDGPVVTSNQEFFGRLATELVKLLAEHTERGHAYRVDLRLRPEGGRGSLARDLASTLHYYDVMGRTWERQALIKARPIAGDHDLGEEFLRRLKPWVYRKYLSFTEISEIKALKRRIEHKALAGGEDLTDVKTGHGGIRDVEFVIQFLQLLNGGDLPALRCANTLLALDRLEDVGCLTDQERHILEDNYRFLRKLEHRLQIMFDLQTHRLPRGQEELRKLALRMGFVDVGPERILGERAAVASLAADLPTPAAAGALPPAEPATAADVFTQEYRAKTERNRRILDHLLHEAFAGEKGASVEPEVDLVLDPTPEPAAIQRVLGAYGFQDVERAYRHLSLLAKESVPFLSMRRCRHFLASIAPRLLRALSQTPDPDLTLLNLERVSASLGGKAVLWELFSSSPPALHLFVEVCASSQFLVDILVSHPGMIDDLMDSLALNQPRSLAELTEELADLCWGAEDRVPILHSFKNKELLRIGVRDILGKDSIETTARNLSDLAEAVLGQIAMEEYRLLARRLGEPTIGEGLRAGQPCSFAILALGKLGGREMSYHSDLDVIFLYEADGATVAPGHTPSTADGNTPLGAIPGGRAAAIRAPTRRFQPTNNFHFFSELARQIIRTTAHLTPHGRLYAIDARLRPTGKSGSLSMPLAEFNRYYQDGPGQLWERQALTKARVVLGLAPFQTGVRHAVAQAAYGKPWSPEMADEILQMRWRMEASRPERDLKRGFGGLVDVEFLVQMLQLKYGATRPQLCGTNTLEVLDALRKESLLSPEEHALLRESYQFLRTVQSRLRMAYNLSRDDLPEERDELEKLARQLGYAAQRIAPQIKDQSAPALGAPPGGGAASERFLADCARYGTRTRQTFLRVFRRHGATRAAETADSGASRAANADE